LINVKFPHSSDHHNITGSILGFTEFIRSQNFNVGLDESNDALTVARDGFAREKLIFKYALKAIFSCSYDDSKLFDTLFEAYWGRHDHEKIELQKHPSTFNLKKSSENSLVLLDFAKHEDVGKNEAKSITGSSQIERLKSTDFSKISELEIDLFEELAEKLWKQISLRLKKRLKIGKKGRLNLRATIRGNVSNGGNMLDLKFQTRKKVKDRLIILLDVSGSMDKYSFFLLRFICALRNYFKDIEAFIFSTKLMRITNMLHNELLNDVIVSLSQSVDHWSGGTQIGNCLKSFNEEHSHYVLRGRTITIFLSDGLDTGETLLLEKEIQFIKQRTRKLIWLNPLKGSKDYQPLTKGMKTALPYIDTFSSAHNLNSIIELENILADV